MNFIINLGLYFFLIPGVSFFLSNFRKSKKEDGTIYENYINGLAWYPVLAIVLYICHLTYIYLPILLLMALAIRGWCQESKSWTWCWTKIFYTLGFVGIFSPIVYDRSIVDIFTYQLRFPRDVFRFDLSAIDGTSIFHSFFNFHHLFLSSLWFNESVINTLAIATQFISLTFVLDLVGKSVNRNKHLWQLSVLGVPLILILSQEAMIDILTILIFTALFLQMSHLGKLTWREAYLIGCAFTFKQPLFVFLLPAAIYFFMKSPKKKILIYSFSIPVTAYVIFQHVFIGVAFFPMSLYLFGSEFMKDAFSLYHETAEIDFHQKNRSLSAGAQALFWRIHPLLILVIFPLLKRNKEAIFLTLSTGFWLFLFPQDRFLLYILPSFLVVIARDLPKNKILLYFSWSLVIGLIAFRSGESYVAYFNRAISKVVPQGKREYSEVADFIPLIPENAVIYSERNTGWYLPGRTITADPSQCRWDPNENWLPQMQKTGVTHLLLRKENIYIADFFPRAPYYEQHKRIEVSHRNRIEEILPLCQPISENESYVLYQMPKVD